MAHFSVMASKPALDVLADPQVRAKVRADLKRLGFRRIAHPTADFGPRRAVVEARAVHGETLQALRQAVYFLPVLAPGYVELLDFPQRKDAGLRLRTKLERRWLGADPAVFRRLQPVAAVPNPMDLEPDVNAVVFECRVDAAHCEPRRVAHDARASHARAPRLAPNTRARLRAQLGLEQEWRTESCEPPRERHLRTDTVPDAAPVALPPASFAYAPSVDVAWRHWTTASALRDGLRLGHAPGAVVDTLLPDERLHARVWFVKRTAAANHAWLRGHIVPRPWTQPVLMRSLRWPRGAATHWAKTQAAALRSACEQQVFGTEEAGDIEELVVARADQCTRCGRCQTWGMSAPPLPPAVELQAPRGRWVLEIESFDQMPALQLLHDALAFLASCVY